MKLKSGRRSFIKKLGVGSVSASLIPAVPFISNANDREGKTTISKLSARTYNGTYENEFLRRVAFPIGGLGAGMFCLEGTGAISHMSVRSKPDVFNEPGMFAGISVKGLAGGAK